MTEHRDRSGAFVECFEVSPIASGSLDGLTFASKDLIDVAGRVTGCGNPCWRETHVPAKGNAVVLDVLLASGATLVGKTVTDELAFSIVGENVHYGTPLNPRALDRVPGGSSSGSASAVACGECDFAIGTDTTGSVRVPAANCGLFGMRPSHGRVSVAGVMPFAPTFDTVGAFARDLVTLARVVGATAGFDVAPGGSPGALELVFLRDAWSLCLPEVSRVGRAWLEAHAIRGAEVGLDEIVGGEGASSGTWLDTHCQIQWAEIEASLGGWLVAAKPTFGPLIEANFASLAAIERPRLPQRVALRERLAALLNTWLNVGRLLCFPTTSAPAPRKGSSFGDRRNDAYMTPTLTLQTFATIARLPQITVPAGEVGGAPIGVSFLAAAGRDAELLGWVERALA